MLLQDEIGKVKDLLQQQRDELVLKLHLAKMEARDEWEKAEAKLEELAQKLEAAGAEAKDAGEDVLASAKSLADEIHQAYERIRNQLN